MVSHDPTDEQYNLYSGTTFALVTADAKLFEHPALKDVAEKIEAGPKSTVWTDDFNNLIQVLK